MICELCDCEGAGFLVSDGIAVCDDCREESQELAQLAYEEATDEALAQQELLDHCETDEAYGHNEGGFDDCPW